SFPYSAAELSRQARSQAPGNRISSSKSVPLPKRPPTEVVPSLQRPALDATAWTAEAESGPRTLQTAQKCSAFPTHRSFTLLRMEFPELECLRSTPWTILRPKLW